MPQILTVKLVNDTLCVDQTNNGNHVHPGPQQQEVHLMLDNGSLPGAIFLPMGAAGGFVWITTPPDGVFLEPTRIGNNRIVRLKVTVNAADPKECWIYMIRVLFNGYIYWTTVSSTDCDCATHDVARLVSNNPIIINR